MDFPLFIHSAQSAAMSLTVSTDAPYRVNSDEMAHPITPNKFVGLLHLYRKSACRAQYAAEPLLRPTALNIVI